jgi:isoamylase
MLLGGDELGRSQGGNNNSWCQDNEISWFDWEHSDGALLEFTRRLVRLRKEHPVFRRTRFFEGRGEELPDVWWMRPDGRKMTQRDWRNGDARSIGVFLNGDETALQTAHGEYVHDHSFLVLFNAHHEPIRFRLPTRRFGSRWTFELSTAQPDVASGGRTWVAREEVDVESRAIVVLKRGW